MTDKNTEDGSPYRALRKAMLDWLKIGWKEVPGLVRTLMNERGGWGILWLGVIRGDRKGYDRPQFVEDHSVKVVIEDVDGRIAFIETIRTDRPRLPEAVIPAHGLGYVGQLVAYGLFDRLMAGTPNESIELPAGIVDAKDFEGFDGSSSDQDKVRRHLLHAIGRAAEREAREETGLRVQVEKVRPEALNANPAWFIHRGSVALAKVLAAGSQCLDATEMPKKLLWLTKAELNEMIDEGRIFDARSIAALRLMGKL